MDRQDLILDNLGLVGKIASNYLYMDDYDDLFQVGCIGLIKAVDAFDSSLNVAFSTYAYRCIQNEVSNYVQRTNRHRGLISLESFVPGTESVQMYEVIEGDTNVESYIVELLLYEDYQSEVSNIQWSERQAQCIRLLQEGYTQRDIAKKYGISPQAVNIAVKGAKNKVFKIIDKIKGE